MRYGFIEAHRAVAGPADVPRARGCARRLLRLAEAAGEPQGAAARGPGGRHQGRLEMAVSRPLPGAGLVAHSDRGSQYASEHYQDLLAGHGIVCGMSRRANCWDNAPMESFFASLKRQSVHHKDYATSAEARANLFEYIEVFYNRVRRHSSLGYRSPVEYERAG